MEISVDNRFPLYFYFRIASQIIKQAKIYRNEGSLDDLYQALTRYSRLMSEIIPQHLDYATYSLKEKIHHKKILQEFVKELEKMKPLLERKNKKIIGQNASRSKQNDNGSPLTSERWNWEDQTFPSYNEGKAICSRSTETKGRRCIASKMEDRNLKLAYDTRVNKKTCAPNQALSPVAAVASRDHDINVNVVRHHFSSILSCVESLPLVGQVSHITSPDSINEHSESSSGGSSSSKDIKDVHISARLMEEFMELARANTEKDIETCGILGAFLTNQTFYVTTLIIPKQEATSNSCQALNEEEIYSIQDGQSLFPVGWIHTHPSQTCFLSSIDLHTQYSYQIMLPEAIAIVMAPTDPARNYGIFRLTDPGGLTVLKECRESGGFHPHPEMSHDGRPIYESCSNVYINPNLRFEIIDLRSAPP